MAPVDTASTGIAAPPEQVYDLLADVTNMGRWSPETYKCQWLDGATDAEPGVRFKGWNKDKLGPLPVRWSTVCTVKAAERGQELSFTVKQSGATWSYTFEPDGDGTKLTETRTDGDKPMVAKLFNRVVPDRDDKLVEGMKQTLQRVKQAAESA